MTKIVARYSPTFTPLFFSLFWGSLRMWLCFRRCLRLRVALTEHDVMPLERGRANTRWSRGLRPCVCIEASNFLSVFMYVVPYAVQFIPFLRYDSNVFNLQPTAGIIDYIGVTSSTSFAPHLLEKSTYYLYMDGWFMPLNEARSFSISTQAAGITTSESLPTPGQVWLHMIEHLAKLAANIWITERELLYSMNRVRLLFVQTGEPQREQPPFLLIFQFFYVFFYLHMYRHVVRYLSTLLFVLRHRKAKK